MEGTGIKHIESITLLLVNCKKDLDIKIKETKEYLKNHEWPAEKETHIILSKMENIARFISANGFHNRNY